ncbi:MAG: SdrD B-like domain-containing protein [Planctomycetota bacterium]
MSLISRMVTRLFGRKSVASSNRGERRRAFRRQLRVESMEERRLLAFGAIGGEVFLDLTDNGDTADDTALVGASIQLFRDLNINGVIDAGDTDLGTQTTNAQGEYLFENLDDGQYIIVQQAQGNLAQRDTVTTQIVQVNNSVAGIAGIPIDRFETVTTPDPLVAANGATASDQQSAPAGVPSEILGGQRDVFVNNDVSSSNDIQVDVDPSGNVFINAGVSTTGDVILTYDGTDADANVNAHNLGVDLTSGDARSIRFNVGSQVGSNLTVEVYSGNDQTGSFLTLPIPTTAGGAPTASLDFDFSNFARLGTATADANFAAVSAIRILVDLGAADDVSVDLVGLVGLSTTDADFPNLNPMTIGDRVFRDANNNGLLDAGEVGIPSVPVQLFIDDGDGSFGAGDTQVANTTTDASGNYLFGGTNALLPGNYFVVIPSTASDPGQPLQNFFNSTGNDPAPGDDGVNNDDNGDVVGAEVFSALITLASATESVTDGDTDANSELTIDFGFVPNLDLAVTKEVLGGATSVTAGNELTYRINLTNNGPSDATNVVLTDNLPNFAPTDITIVNVTSSLSGTIVTNGPSTGEITVTHANLAAGQTDVIDVTVRFPADTNAATAIDNVVEVVADEFEANTANNTAQVAVDVTRASTLTITKTESADPVAVGGALGYTIVVTNTGPSTATNVSINDSLPVGLTLNGNPTATLGTVAVNGSQFTVTVPSLGVTESTTITVNTTVDPSFAGTSVINTATATADESTTVQATEDTTINPSIDLAVTKVDDIDPINRGATLTYTMVVTNNGPSAATNVQLNDTLPTGLTFVSASSTQGTVNNPTAGSSSFSVDIGSLNASGTATVTVTATVDNNAPSTVSNTATVTSDQQNFESDTTNNSATQATSINDGVDLVMTKIDSADPVIAGNQLTYTMQVTNNGAVTANNVQFSDPLPAGVTFASANASQGAVSDSSGTVSGNLGSIAAGSSATVTIVVNVDPAATGTLSNTATVSADETEIDTSNNSATEPTTINSTVDLQITKVDNASVVAAGGSLNYEIVVLNNGPSTATSVVLTDALPTGLAFVSGVSTAGNVVESGGVVTVDIGTLAPGNSATINLNTTVDASATGTITNVASVAAAEGETDTTNNSASDDVVVDILFSKRLLIAYV